MTHTDRIIDGGKSWWRCEFGGWYKIRTVKIHNRWECCERINNAAVYLGKKHIGNVKYDQGIKTALLVNHF